ncbi:uncharacterized protein LOC111519028 [Drosophila willistoni]|uniref:uncharacterized protein LOC111519028 n=1 Tax=Drosophila willistoni TaxID=7260 RepID=UPI000C26DACB|nr:uncharacterized protein LOC111519028 [Drosophila willistoni]
MLPILTIPFIASGLGFGTYFFYHDTELLVISRWLELVASAILLYGILKAENQYKSSIMLFWLGSASVLFLTLVGSLWIKYDYILYPIIADVILGYMMYILYKEYLKLTEEATISSWRFCISHSPKHVLTVAPLVVLFLAYSTFSNTFYYENSSRNIGCVCVLGMSILLMFGIFLAEPRHLGPILFFWFLATYAFFNILLFSIDRATLFVITANVLIAAVMYIVYKSYIQLEKNRKENNFYTEQN